MSRLLGLLGLLGLRRMDWLSRLLGLLGLRRMDWLSRLLGLLGLLGLLSRLEGLEDVGSDDLGGGLLLAEPLNHVLHNGEVGLVALQLGHEVGDEGVLDRTCWTALLSAIPSRRDGASGPSPDSSTQSPQTRASISARCEDAALDGSE